MKKALSTAAKDQVKLSVRLDTGHVLCLFYVRAYLREGQLHSHFVTGFYFFLVFEFYKFSIWEEEKWLYIYL